MITVRNQHGLLITALWDKIYIRLFFDRGLSRRTSGNGLMKCSTTSVPATSLSKLRMVVSWFITLLIFLIRSFQAVIRPWLIGTCKFCPSCSEYTIEALQTHGLWRGIRMGANRIFRCHPFSPGGIDPVPSPLKRM